MGFADAHKGEEVRFFAPIINEGERTALRCNL